jgi:hypothetical protein
MQKFHVENFFRENYQKVDKNFDVSSSSTCFVLSRFQVFLSDGSSKALQKTCHKKIVSKSFYKKIDKKSKTDFFSIFFLSRFWAFLGEGSSKTRQKKLTEKSAGPDTFLASEEPTNHVGVPLDCKPPSNHRTSGTRPAQWSRRRWRGRTQ